MQIQRENLADYQRYYKRSGEPVCLITKLLVDDTYIECSNVILTGHSAEFCDKEEVVLHEFSGEVDKVHDILELLHGYEVHIDIGNVEVIAKFGIIYKCKDLVSIAKKWLEKAFGRNSEQDTILNLTRIVLKIFKQGHIEIVQNIKVKEGITSNAEVIIKKLTQSGVKGGLFFLHFILDADKTLQHGLPPLSDSIDTEYKYKIALNLVNKLIDTDPVLVVTRTEQMEAMFEKGMELLSNQASTILHSRTVRRFDQLKQDMLTGVVQTKGSILTDLTPILDSGSWKNYDWKEIVGLKENTNITEFQYFDVVINWFRNNGHVDEKTKCLLISSLDEYLFEDMHEVINGCLGNNNYVYYAPSSELSSDYKYSSCYMYMGDYQLICNNETQTVFRQKSETAGANREIHIQNVKNRAQVVYLAEDGETCVHWFACKWDWRSIGNHTYDVYTKFGSLVTDTYEGFVAHILKKNKHIKLCGLYKNSDYEVN